MRQALRAVRAQLGDRRGHPVLAAHRRAAWRSPPAVDHRLPPGAARSAAPRRGATHAPPERFATDCSPASLPRRHAAALRTPPPRRRPRPTATADAQAPPPAATQRRPRRLRDHAPHARDAARATRLERPDAARPVAHRNAARAHRDRHRAGTRRPHRSRSCPRTSSSQPRDASRSRRSRSASASPGDRWLENGGRVALVGADRRRQDHDPREARRTLGAAPRRRATWPWSPPTPCASAPRIRCSRSGSCWASRSTRRTAFESCLALLARADAVPHGSHRYPGRQPARRAARAAPCACSSRAGRAAADRAGAGRQHPGRRLEETVKRFAPANRPAACSPRSTRPRASAACCRC